nr:septin-4-like isoform X3 [Pelodiscus sinensis]|eukprot:XP_014428416.1 septin-4-like isoform X3 [Pelodiscus sinensis]
MGPRGRLLLSPGTGCSGDRRCETPHPGSCKLTRESGTDFPIPVIPAGPDAETEKLIREKDEELRRMQEMLQKIQRQMKDSH